ncbi:jcdg [Acrasis kona]|uniref:Bifunctional lysine-specific demethylase and histidyl-hydroxylase n=1 Tax=Acrasis kona TaxID=1008807 RepID=A0AAW2Z6N4_9EUKA
MCIKRGMPEYYQGVYSKDVIDQLLVEQDLHYGTDIDLTLYKDGKRHTLNPSSDQSCDRDLVWNYYNMLRCSIRILRPHEYDNTIGLMLNKMERYFNLGAGCNAYLTPSQSQGFAPHYDDIEAFVVQLEGKKLWKLYHPINEDNMLPRHSSGNFTADEIKDYLAFEVWLEPGDILYMPRGTIHQASTMGSDVHSLHLTFSTAQNMSYADYLAKVIPEALNAASECCVEFRESLPRGFSDYMGYVHQLDESNDDRYSFTKKVSTLMDKLIEYLPLDECADKMTIHFLHSRQPTLTNVNDNDRHVKEFTRVKLADRRSVCLVIEEEDDNDVDEEEDDDEDNEDQNTQDQDDQDENTKTPVCSLYYSTCNSKVYQQLPPQKLQFEIEYEQALCHLIRTCEQGPTDLADLPGLTDEEKNILVVELLKKNLIVVE